MAGEVHLLNDSEQARKRAWSTFDNIDQFVWLNSDLGASDSLTLDHNYLADGFGARLTETGRLAYIKGCIKNGTGPVQWAMCQGDIERLDIKKALAEVRENKAYAGWDKIRLRIMIDGFKVTLTEHAAKVKQLIASDPGYAKMFELAAATRKDWDERYKADAALIALADKMDDARITNCGAASPAARTRHGPPGRRRRRNPGREVRGHARRRGGPTENSSSTVRSPPITNNPETYLASVALVTCFTCVGQEHDVPARHPGPLPRHGDEHCRDSVARATAASWDILMSGITLDDRDASSTIPRRAARSRAADRTAGRRRRRLQGDAGGQDDDHRVQGGHGEAGAVRREPADQPHRPDPLRRRAAVRGGLHPQRDGDRQQGRRPAEGEPEVSRRRPAGRVRLGRRGCRGRDLEAGRGRPVDRLSASP